MRVTSTMMTNNALINMARNKETYDKYLQQYSTQKKIQRPSDDPVVAVRSLKYRTRLSELEQYLYKNVPDAVSWTSATEKNLTDINKVLTTMYDYCEQAANGTLAEDDKAKIVSTLTEYKGYIYEQNANYDNTGRYLFTGYRTDVPLLFDSDQTNTTYQITEKLSATDIKSFSYVYGGAEYAAGTTASGYAQDAPEYLDTHRMTLSYKNMDADQITFNYVDAAGAVQTLNVTTQRVQDDSVYNEHYKPRDDEAFFVPETGEIVFGDNVYAAVCESREITVEYKKTNFGENDIRPEHYFDCIATNNDTGVVKNYQNPADQKMVYQINFSQTLTVNTLACESIDMGIGRSIEDIVNIVNEMEQTKSALADAEKRLSDCDASDTAGVAAYEQLIEQIENKLTLQETMLTNAFTNGMTVCKAGQDKLNVALADLGARMNRLNSTQAKLEELEISFTESLSENENVDLGEAYIRYNEADLLYQATLQATAKTLGNTLLDFI